MYMHMQLRIELTPQRSTAVSLAPADGQVHFVMSTCCLSQSTSHPYLHPPTPPTPHPCSHNNHNADDDNDDSVEMPTVLRMMKSNMVITMVLLVVIMGINIDNRDNQW